MKLNIKITSGCAVSCNTFLCDVRLWTKAILIQMAKILYEI